ncbi:MAG: hypothetical protein L6Q71_03555 [Planctomycetes bacterium]|nr:hypothetical protein [Planctomycetota bacterium]
MGALTGERRGLSEAELAPLVADLLDDRMPLAQAGALLIALRMKDESVTEVVTLAKAISQKTRRIEVKRRPLAAIDIVSLDGAQASSAMLGAALTVGGAGFPTVQHGSMAGAETRASSTEPGIADLLAALDVNLHLPRGAVADGIDKTGYGFMLARYSCASLGQLTSVFRELTVPTIFNLAAPFANPAMPEVRIVAVTDPESVGRTAEALRLFGAQRGYVFCLEDDVLTRAGKIALFEKRGSQTFDFRARDHGLSEIALQWPSGSAADQARELDATLRGKSSGPMVELMVLTAGLTLHALGAAPTLAKSFAMARESLTQRKAENVLAAIRKAYATAEVTDDGRTSKVHW